MSRLHSARSGRRTHRRTVPTLLATWEIARPASAITRAWCHPSHGGVFRPKKGRGGRRQVLGVSPVRRSARQLPANLTSLRELHAGWSAEWFTVLGATRLDPVRMCGCQCVHQNVLNTRVATAGLRVECDGTTATIAVATTATPPPCGGLPAEKASRVRLGHRQRLSRAWAAPDPSSGKTSGDHRPRNTL